MPHTLQRATLITGIFAAGSLLLCCLSGAVGWFNAYWTIAFALAACGFFLLVAWSIGLCLPASRQNDGAHRDGVAPPAFVQTFRELAFGKNTSIVISIAVLFAAHVFILTNNISPGENLLSNHDQGMYLAAASNLSAQGQHAMATDWISQAPDEYKRFLTKEISPSLKTESPGDVTNTGTQVGFYRMDDDGFSQYIQFPPGYPTILATFWSLGGYGLAAYSNIIICLLCGLMLAAVGRNFIGGTSALATWLLFLFCPLTIWSANHLYAEPTLLLLWLVALWALGFSREHPLLAATLASLSIGAAFLVKIDALPLLIIPLGYAFIYKDEPIRFRITFLILSIVAYALAAGFYLHYSRPYFEFTLSGLFTGHLLFWGMFVLSLMSVALTFKPIRLKLSAVIQAHSQLLRYGLAIAIGLILICFYWVRPHIAEPHTIFSGASGKEIESLREQTFYRLGWYFTPVGLALASAGLVAAFIKRIRPAQLAFVGIAALFLLYYSYDIHCTPYQPYAMRRLFSFVVPALCFSIPFLIQSIPIRRYSAITKISLTVLITTALLFNFQQISRKLILRENYKGLCAYLSAVSRELPENALILINGKGKACTYAAPLRYVFGQECILVYPDYRDRDYHAMIRALTKDDKGAVYVLSAAPNDRMSIRAEIVSTRRLADTLQTSYSGTAMDYPDKDIEHLDVSLYLTELKIP